MTDYSGYSWIKVPRYKMNEKLDWPARYRELNDHHIQETTFLIEEVRSLAEQLAAAKRQIATLRQQAEAAQREQSRRLRWEHDSLPYYEDDRDG